jgi:hypothetical protein
LFQGLLGGDVSVLIQDSLSHPDRYDAVILQLLTELGAGTKTVKTLTRAEALHLDRATIDFASAKPVGPPAPKAHRPTRAQSETPSDPYAPGLQDGRAPQVEDAGGPRDAYWWA